jgi:hypothetical protein
MAERKSTARSRSSGGGSKRSGSKSGSKSSGSKSSGSKKGRAGASSKRTPTATQQEPPSRRSPTGGDQDNGDMSKDEESHTGGKAMGRPPADEPDVYVYVPELHVGELNIDVKRLEAHLALRAQVANLVNLVAGVHVGVDEVKIDLKDVNAECELKVRLENTYNILDRTLTTLDENPQVVEQLLQTADTAVQETGQIGKEATKPGGAVSELTSGVGDSLGNLTNSVGETLSSVADKANPKKLLNSGNGAKGGTTTKSRGSSGGSGTAKAAATAGAAGAAGLAGAALLGGRRKGLFHRRGALEKLVDQVTGQLGKRRRGKAADKVLP